MPRVAVKAKVLQYDLELARGGRLTAGGEAPLDLDPAWTPEHLLLAGLVRCSLQSLRYHARRAGLDVVASGSVHGTVTKRESDGRYALVEARLHTGRLHQIRRHLKHISCPIIGDVRYGKGEHNRIFRTQHDLHRLALHCTALAISHPDGPMLSVTSPLPLDLAAAVESCRRHYADRGNEIIVDV